MQNEGLVLTIGRQMVPFLIARVQEGQIGGDDAEIVSRQTPPPFRLILASKALARVITVWIFRSADLQKSRRGAGR